MFFDEASVSDGGQHCASFHDGWGCDSLALDLGQYQPAVIPAAYTGRVANDLPLGFIKAF